MLGKYRVRMMKMAWLEEAPSTWIHRSDSNHDGFRQLFGHEGEQTGDADNEANRG